MDPATFYARGRRLEREASARERKQPIYGLTIVSCEGGDMRQSPDGVFLYTDDGCEEIICDPWQERATDFIAMRDALAHDRPVFPDGPWGRATIEVILAILESSREGRDVELTYQVPTPV
jgi:phthalate 4,5-cis-dihydrodiol dehydrogenase